MRVHQYWLSAPTQPAPAKQARCYFHQTAPLPILTKIFLFDLIYRSTNTQQGDKLDSREQACMGACQDRYLQTRQEVQQALQNRQGGMM